MSQSKLVEIYYKTTCPYCQKALRLLNSKEGINLNTINIENNDELRNTMITRANGKTTVPQIFINNEHIGGCDDMMKLEQDRVLDQKLYD